MQITISAENLFAALLSPPQVKAPKAVAPVAHDITKPMLAVKCDPDELTFPVLATPKLDGIRCLKVGGQALTRSFLPIPNRFVREWIEANLPDGVDGELMVRGGSFSETTSAINSTDGEPDFVFHVFDFVERSITTPYSERIKALAALLDSDRVVKVMPVEVNDAAELTAFVERCMAEGYEGAMVRTPDSPYKCGRSTVRQGYLLKIKRFEDAEAVVLESYEAQSNQNAAELDAFGNTKRGMSKAGMVGRNELGGFVVKHLRTGVKFRLAYNHITGGLDRSDLWSSRESIVGKVVKFSHQPSGAKEAPRFPIFLGFRENWDMSA